jgi:hypothetical protein
MVAAAALEELLVALLPEAVPVEVGVELALDEEELVEAKVRLVGSIWPQEDFSVAAHAAWAWALLGVLTASALQMLNSCSQRKVGIVWR